MRKIFWALVGVLSFPCYATLVSESAVTAALAFADLEAEVEILSRNASADPASAVRNSGQARVLRILGGRHSSAVRADDVIEIIVPGGEHNGVGVLFGGMPRLHLGKRYHAHLKLQSAGYYTVVGLDAGFVTLNAPRTASRNRTDGSNGEGQGALLFWDDSYLPIPYYLSFNSFKNRSFFLDAVDASFRAWQQAPNTKVNFYAMGCSTTVSNENDGLNNIIFISEDWPYDPAAIAITRNFYVSSEGPRSGMILDTDILINGVNHQFTSSDESGSYDVQNILTHEIGHLLGLGHEVTPEDTDAVMYARAEPNEVKKRTLGEGDLAVLQEAYAGSGPKVPMTATSTLCSVPETNAACMAAHRPGPIKTPWAWLACYLVTGFILFFGGRIVILASGIPGELSQ